MSLAPPPVPPAEPQTTNAPRFQMTRSMVSTLMSAGLLNEERFELIEGEIVYKMSKKQPHVFATFQAVGWLNGVFGRDFVQEEKPIAVNDTNEPEPDVSVLSNSRHHYLTAGTPPAADVRLVIEVSDTTLWNDRTVKARLYAGAGIPEYWVIDITGRQIFVHRNPLNGMYQLVTVHLETESISPLTAPQATVLISTLLP